MPPTAHTVWAAGGMAALAQDQDMDARPRQLYRRPKARRARADDQYVGFHDSAGSPTRLCTSFLMSVAFRRSWYIVPDASGEDLSCNEKHTT